MPCDLNQLVADGTQFKDLPKWKYDIAALYMWALLLQAIGGEDFTDLAALFANMQQYGKMTENEYQAAYLQVLYESLADSRAGQPTQEQIDEVLRLGQCTPPDIVRKATLCVISQLAASQTDEQ